MKEIDDFKFDGEHKLSLKEIRTDYTGKYHSKEEAKEKLQENIEHMIEQQDILYADGRYALLLSFRRWMRPARMARSSMS